MIISHRGKTLTCGHTEENHPITIEEVSKKYKVEVDLWKINDRLYLGHDGPTYSVSREWLQYYNPNLFLHAKNIEAMLFIMNNLRYSWGFWHQNDDYALTYPDNRIIVYPGKALVRGAIVMKPELYPYDLLKESQPYAVCTDFPENFEEFA